MTHYLVPLVISKTDAKIFENINSIDEARIFVDKKIEYLKGDLAEDYFYDYYSLPELDSSIYSNKIVHEDKVLTIKEIDLLLNNRFGDRLWFGGGLEYILPEPGWIKKWLFCDEMPMCEHIGQKHHLCYINPCWDWNGLIENLGNWYGILLDVHR